VQAGPDASKVIVCGEGIKNGILATFESGFTVDTRGAGPGQLTVKVRAKKGKGIFVQFNLYKLLLAVTLLCLLSLPSETLVIVSVPSFFSFQFSYHFYISYFPCLVFAPHMYIGMVIVFAFPTPSGLLLNSGGPDPPFWDETIVKQST